MRGNYLSYKAGEIASRILPKRLAYSAAPAAAGVYAFAPREDIRAVQDNLRSALGPVSDALIQKKARELVRNYSRYLVDFHYDRSFTPDFIRKQVTIDGLDGLQRALEAGKGALLASAHFGNWELAGIALAELGYPIHAVALEHHGAGIDRIFRRRRQRHGFHVMPVGGYQRELYRILKKNEILGMNVDRFFTGEMLDVDFFARQVPFPSGFARLSLSSGAPIFTGFFISLGYERFHFEIHTPIEGDSPQVIVQEYARRLESVIRRYPTQWFIFQRYWERAVWPA